MAGSIILLQLVKIEILDPSGGVLSLYVDFICLRIHKIQIWRRSDLKDPYLNILLWRGLGPLQHRVCQFSVLFRGVQDPSRWTRPPRSFMAVKFSMVLTTFGKTFLAGSASKIF